MDETERKNVYIKILKDDIFEIRKLLEMGLRQSEIAKKFDVDQAVISSIKTRKSWAHI